MRRALAFVLKTAVWTSALAAMIAAATLAWPGWLLNSRTLAAAVRHFGRDCHPTWKDLRLEVGGGLLAKRVRLEASDFCFEDARGGAQGCFPRFELDATIRLGLSPPVSALSLEKLVVRSSALRLDGAVTSPRARGRARRP